MNQLCALAMATAFALAGCAGSRVQFPTAGDRAPAQISGDIFKPEGNGPFPAVVLLHGCNGVSSLQINWAIALKQQGFVTLVVDSFTPREVSEICTSRRGLSIYERIEDAYGGLLYLTKLPYVDPTRVGVIGWSHGGNAALRLLMANDAYGERIAGQRRFAVGVAFYPWCGVHWSLYKWRPDKLLVFAGEADQWTPGMPCKSYQEAGIEVYVFPGAYHGFDNPSAPNQPTEVRGAITFGGGRALIAYHPQAAAEAEKITRRFLAKQLGSRSQDPP